MNERFASILNPILKIFGRKIVRRFIGHWHSNPPRRDIYPIGWRLARSAEQEGTTELGRFIENHKEEIQLRRKAAQ